MPPSELAQQILAENESLRDDIGELTAKLDELDDKGRHTRWAVYALSVVVVLVGFFYITDRLDNLSDYDKATCEASNGTRAEALSMWTDASSAVAALGGKGSKEFAAGLQAKAERTYAQRDCAAAEDGNTAPVKTTIPTGGMQ